MTRERSSEGWAVDKLRMVSQIKPKYRKWTPGVTGTIDRDEYNRHIIDPYDYEPLHPPPLESMTILQLGVADCGVTGDALAVVTPESAMSVSSCGTETERFALSSIRAGDAFSCGSEVDMKRGRKDCVWGSEDVYHK